MELVLNLDEPVCELANLMVIDQRDGSNDLLLFFLPGFIHQLITDEIADRLRTIGKALLGDYLVEPLKESTVHRNPESDELRHTHLLERFLGFLMGGRACQADHAA